MWTQDTLFSPLTSVAETSALCGQETSAKGLGSAAWIQGHLSLLHVSQPRLPHL